MYKKLKNSRLLSGSATYLFSNMLNAAIPFLLLPIFTRILSPAEYGEIAMFQTLVAALAAFTGLSVQGAANRKYYDEQMTNLELKQYIGSCLQVLAVSSLVVLLLIYCARDWVAGWLNLELRWVLWAVFVSAVGFIFNIRLGQWLIRKEARKFGAFQVSQSLVNMALSLLLVVVLLLGAEGRIVAQICSAGFFAVLAVYFLWRDDLLLLSGFRRGYWREILAFGVPLLPHVAGMFLLTSVDRIVINSELGLAQAGIYMVAVQLSMVLGVVFDAINKAYVPWLYERLARNVEAEKRQLVAYTYAYFLIVLLVAGALFILGPGLVTKVAGPQYSSSAGLIGWLAVGQAFNGMYLMVTNYVFYSKQTGLLSLTSVFSGLLNVLLLLFFIQWKGLEGAAMAFAIAMAFRFVVTWRVAHLKHPMPWSTISRETA